MVPKSMLVLTHHRCTGKAWRCLRILEYMRLCLTQGLARVQLLQQASQDRSGVCTLGAGIWNTPMDPPLTTDLSHAGCNNHQSCQHNPLNTLKKALHWGTVTRQKQSSVSHKGLEPSGFYRVLSLHLRASCGAIQGPASALTCALCNSWTLHPSTCVLGLLAFPDFGPH